MKKSTAKSRSLLISLGIILFIAFLLSGILHRHIEDPDARISTGVGIFILSISLYWIGVAIGVIYLILRIFKRPVNHQFLFNYIAVQNICLSVSYFLFYTSASSGQTYTGYVIASLLCGAMMIADIITDNGPKPGMAR